MDFNKINSCRKRITIFLLVVITHFLAGCSTWRILPAENISSEVESVSMSDKYIIVHKQDSSAWRLRNAVVFKNRNTIYGNLEQLGAIKKDRKTTYMHLFITDYVQAEDLEVQIPISAIYKIEYFKKEGDAGKSILLVIGIIFGPPIIDIIFFGCSGCGGL